MYIIAAISATPVGLSSCDQFSGEISREHSQRITRPVVYSMISLASGSVVVDPVSYKLPNCDNESVIWFTRLCPHVLASCSTSQGFVSRDAITWGLVYTSPHLHRHNAHVC